MKCSAVSWRFWRMSRRTRASRSSFRLALGCLWKGLLSSTPPWPHALRGHHHARQATCQLPPPAGLQAARAFEVAAISEGEGRDPVVGCPRHRSSSQIAQPELWSPGPRPHVVSHIIWLLGCRLSAVSQSEQPLSLSQRQISVAASQVARGRLHRLATLGIGRPDSDLVLSEGRIMSRNTGCWIAFECQASPRTAV